MVKLLVCMAPMLLLQAALYKTRKPTNVWRECLFACFSLLLIAILFVTGLHLNGLRSMQSSYHSINLTPFYIIRQYIENGFPSYARMNILGNIAMFMPVGVLLPALYKRNRFLRTVLFGALFSFLIEFLQLFSARNTDIDDLILNTLGTALGYLCFCLLRALFPRLYAKVALERGGFLQPLCFVAAGIVCVAAYYA